VGFDERKRATTTTTMGRGYEVRDEGSDDEDEDDKEDAKEMEEEGEDGLVIGGRDGYWL
jgi:hypothetical protein